MNVFILGLERMRCKKNRAGEARLDFLLLCTIMLTGVHLYQCDLVEVVSIFYTQV